MRIYVPMTVLLILSVITGCGEAPPGISIHEAAAAGNIKALRYHIRKKVPVDLELDGRTPIDLAIIENRVESVKYLLESGASVGRSQSIDLALNLSDQAILSLLLDAGGDSSYALSSSARLNKRPLVKLLLGRGANPTMAFQDCARRDDVSMLGFLVEAGASPDAKTDKGENLLHWAVLEGNLKMVEWLLVNKADVNAVSVFRETPLQIAQDRKNSKMVALLKKHGAK